MSLIIGGIISGSLYTLIALGLILIIRVTGAINFAQGDVGSVGAFVAIDLAGKSVGMPLGWAVVVGVAAGAGINVAIYLLLCRRLERIRAESRTTMIVTVGASLVIEAILTRVYGFNPYTFTLFQHVATLTIGGVRVPGSGTFIVASAAVTLLAFGFVLHRTTVGRILRMGSSNAALAELVGVRMILVRTIVWALAGAIAAWGVMLFASYQSISTSTMGSFLLTAAVAASWGAFRSFGLTLGGAVILGIVLNVVSRYVQSDISYLVCFGILAIVFLGHQAVSGRATAHLHSVAGVARNWLTREVRPTYRAHPSLFAIEVVGVLVAIIVWLSANSPGSYGDSLVMQVGAALAILAGLSMSFNYGHKLNLSAGGFTAIGGYLFAIVGAHDGVVVGVIVALAVSGGVGALMGALTAGMEQMFYATLTLVFTVAVPELINIFSSQTGGTEGLILAPQLIGENPAWLIGIGGVVVASALVWFGLSRRGATTLVCTSDRRLAHVGGHRDIFAVMTAEGLGGLLMGLGGVALAVSAGSLDPSTYTVGLSIGYLAVVVVGGGWSVVGLFAGALFYVLIPAALSSLQYFVEIIYGGGLILAVLAVPAGIEGAVGGVYGQISRALGPLGRKRGATERPELEVVAAETRERQHVGD